MCTRVSAVAVGGAFLLVACNALATDDYPARYAPLLVSDPSGNFQDIGDGLASDPYANFVAVWTEQSDFDFQIAARRVSANGQPLGPVIAVTDVEGDFNLWPSVASDGAGNFTVAWAHSAAHDLQTYDIRVRHYDTQGRPIDDEAVVNDSSMPASSSPRIAMNAAGDYVLAWSRMDARNSTVARVFNSAGIPIGNEFELPFLENATEYAVVLTGARKVIAQGGSIDAHSVNSIKLQCFDPQGLPLSSAMTLSNSGADAHIGALAVGPADSIDVSWAQTRNDSATGKIYSTVSVASLQSDCTTIDWQREAAAVLNTEAYVTGTKIAANPDTGELAVGWRVSGSGGYAVSVRRYDSSGIARGAPVLLASDGLPLSVPQLALRGAGYTAAWNQLNYETYTDVYAQAFGTPPSLPSPQVTLTLGSATIQVGGSVALTWESHDADSCIASGNWSGDKPVNGTQDLSPMTAGEFVYTLSCSGAGGVVDASQTLTVKAADSADTDDADDGQNGGAFGEWTSLMFGLAAALRRRLGRRWSPGFRL